MDIMNKIEKWFQVGAAALFVIFALFNLVRTFIQNSAVFYALCFAAMTVVSWYLLKIAWRELKEEEMKEPAEDINKNEEDEV